MSVLCTSFYSLFRDGIIIIIVINILLLAGKSSSKVISKRETVPDSVKNCFFWFPAVQHNEHEEQYDIKPNEKTKEGHSERKYRHKIHMFMIRL